MFWILRGGDRQISRLARFYRLNDDKYIYDIIGNVRVTRRVVLVLYYNFNRHLKFGKHLTKLNQIRITLELGYLHETVV